jgi:hypothetical protein
LSLYISILLKTLKYAIFLSEFFVYEYTIVSELHLLAVYIVTFLLIEILEKMVKLEKIKKVKSNYVSKVRNFVFYMYKFVYCDLSIQKT